LADVFISYAHATAREARAAAEALRAAGYSIWMDDDLPAHQPFRPQIQAELSAAKAALVIWSAAAATSDWVLSEADRARESHKLVQLRLDGARLPMPFDQIQCTDLAGWTGDTAHSGWRKVLASIAELVSGAAPQPAPTPAPAPSTPAPALPDKASIAVLPFADPSGAAEGDYFADGMVDEIVTALSRFPALFVIDSGSSLSFRERERDLKVIGRELGVRYLLQGSVRRSGPRVRIAVSLVEAADGAQVWADRFEGTLEDVFAVQDEVANAAAARIEPSIQAADLRRGAARPTSDQSAYDLFLRGRQRVLEYDKASWVAAKALFEQAVERDPRYALAWAFLAWGEAAAASWGWSDDPDASRRNAQEPMRRALAFGSDDPRVLAVVALTSLFSGGDPRACLAMADRALSLNPGSAICWMNSAWVSQMSGHPEQALERIQHAMRLDPRTPDRGSLTLGYGSTLLLLTRYDEAIPWLEEAAALRPNNPVTLFLLTDAYARLGRIDEAKAMLVRAEAFMPARDWMALGETLPAIRGPVNERYRATLRSLGAAL
jgi:adenylate cyclase